jgi:hypothetical protein
MEQKNGGAIGALEALRARVDQWREGCGGKRSRIPEELWDAAVVVARRDGVFVTAKTTRLHYGALKKRVEQPAKSAPVERTVPAFIEVAMAADVAPPVTSGAAESKTVVEFEGRGGGRLRVEVTGTSAVDVMGLAREFWSLGR